MLRLASSPKSSREASTILGSSFVVRASARASCSVVPPSGGPKLPCSCGTGLPALLHRNKATWLPAPAYRLSVYRRCAKRPARALAFCSPAFRRPKVALFLRNRVSLVAQQQGNKEPHEERSMFQVPSPLKLETSPVPLTPAKQAAAAPAARPPCRCVGGPCR